MIPEVLRLRNFLSYRECTVDFRGLHLAVLCGRNGDGKSALLDAMTWALWGEGRGGKDEHFIHLGADEMIVDFTFRVGDDRFRVVRKRSRGRATGSIEFMQIAEDGSLAAHSGGTMPETKAEIERYLRMDHETFANSAFLAQGHAGDFTNKTPGKRKEIFSKVLGLERYEELAKAARDRSSYAARDHQGLEQRIAKAQAEVARLPQVEADLAEAAAALAAIGPRRELAEASVLELRQAAADYRRLEGEQDLARTRLATAESSVTAAGAALRKLEGELEAARAILARGGEIEARHRALGEARAADQALAARQGEAHGHELTMERARREIAAEQGQLEANLANGRKVLAELEGLAAGLPALQEEALSLAAARDGLSIIAAQITAAYDRASRAREEVASREVEQKHCKDAARQIKEKEAQLEGAAVCPVCRQPLAEGEAEHVRTEYAAQRRDLGERYRAAEEAAAAANKEARAASDEAARLEQESKQRETALRERESASASRLARAAEAAAALAAARQAVAEATIILERGEFARAARETLAAAQRAHAAAGYDPAAHEAARELVRMLAPAEAEFRDLEGARGRAGGMEQVVAQAAAALVEKQDAVTSAREALAEAAAVLAAATDVTPRLAAAEGTLAEVRREHEALATRLGQLGEQRQALMRLQADLETAADNARAAKEEQQVYGDLAAAFGKNGVQAMLIDQSLPAMEAHANAMLDRMTGGQIHVALTTQRANATGTMSDTLDILISDELGTRDYGMYSGGEAFRVDFALRIALARLLAARAGASLPTLIIDEGFGTQDAEGLDRLFEGITAVAPDFELILVVTHIDELKERFDRRIEVTKDPVDGSKAVVV